MGTTTHLDPRSATRAPSTAVHAPVRVMRTPVAAMLWENWRLTRVEAAGRMAFTVVVGALAASTGEYANGDGNGALQALFVAVVIHATLWMSIAKLNGGRFLDGYHPGFPLHLLYTRPVRTSVLVGVSMGYAAASAAVLYLVWALLMNAAFEQQFPLVPIAAWIGVLQLVQAAAYWATRSKVVQWVGSFAAFAACLILALRRAGGDWHSGNGLHPDQWPMLFDYSLVDYGLMVAISSAAIGLTVLGVAQQRRGDAKAPKPRAPGRARSADWLTDLFAVPCPTSSAVRAQIWFDFKSSGLGVLATGVVFAILILLLSALGGPVAGLRPFAFATPFAVVFVVLSGGNAFGIRRRQGRTYTSVFDATQACGTGSLAGLKIVTRTLCVAGALAMVGASLWVSVPWMNAWPGAGQEGAILLGARNALAAAVSGFTVYEHAAVAILAFSAIAVMVALRASLEALFARYRRRVIAATALVLLYGLVVALVVFTAGGRAQDIMLLNFALGAVPVLGGLAVALVTPFLFWRTVAERIIAPHQAAAVVLVFATVVVAWVTLLNATGAPVSQMPPLLTALALSPALLALTALVLAPWSLSRIRHQ